jgi:hypothetical protein
MGGSTRKPDRDDAPQRPDFPAVDGESFSDRGVSFTHASGWSVSCEEKPRERVVTVTSPTSGFWSLMVFLDRPEPDDVLETVIESFRDEFKDLDIYEAEEEICGQPALARDVGFFCYDLTNTAEIRVFQTERLTVLVLSQATDDDWDEVEAEIHQITATLDLDESQLAIDSFTLGDFDDDEAAEESLEDSEE